MSRNQILAAVIVAIVILAGALYYYWGKLVPTSTDNDRSEKSTEQMISYTNSHGFSLAYPATLDKHEYNNEDVVFGHVSGDAVDGVVEVRVVDLAGEPGETLIEAASRELMNLCAADGPQSSFYCTKVERSEPFVTDSGLGGQTIYLHGEMKDLQSGSTTTIEKGPYVVIPLQSGATGSQVVVIHPPLNQSAAEADVATIMKVAKSIERANTANEDPVALYIEEHIGDLSPVSPALGGHFYVTSVEAHGGAGTVEYEDGHLAFTADFTYKVDAQGNVAVDSFTVRGK